jgi:hypothetical protein
MQLELFGLYAINIPIGNHSRCLVDKSVLKTLAVGDGSGRDLGR